MRPYHTRMGTTVALRAGQVCIVIGVHVAGCSLAAKQLLLPDRLADYLTTIDMTMNAIKTHHVPKECIISFHPWFKMSRRGR